MLGGYVGDHSYHGPEAKPVVKPDGFLADTHEVAAAKNLHLGALSQASAHSGSYDGHSADLGDHSGAPVGYHGPKAVPKVGCLVVAMGWSAQTGRVMDNYHLNNYYLSF